MLRMEAVLPGVDALKQIAAVRHAWWGALQNEQKTIEVLYKRTTENWKTDVQFKSKLGSNNKEWYAEVKAENRIYWFVHEGIAVMHAVLSPNWVPKTKPLSLRSGPGRGHLVTVNPKHHGKLYEARKFTETIIEKRKVGFQKMMEKATEAAVRKAAGG